MADVIATLHRRNDPTANIYPNVKDTNIPDTILRVADLGKYLNLLPSLKISGDGDFISVTSDVGTFTTADITTLNVSGLSQFEGKATFGSDMEVDGGLTLNSPSDLHFKRGDTDYTDFNDFKALLYGVYYQGKYSGGYISADFASIAVNPDLAKVCTAYQYIFEKCEFEAPTYNLPDVARGSRFSESFYRVIGLTNVTLGDGDSVYATNMFRFPNSIESIKVRDGKSFRPIDGNTMFGGYEGTGHITDIEGIDFSECQNLGNAFFGCPYLKVLKCTHFRISFDISSSAQFEQSDLVNIIGSLDSVASPQTLTMGATNLAKLTQDQILVATGKGWTLA